MKHLLVTNDFPPKVGGIQTYLWELWRRLPSDGVAVLTTPYRGARAWDAEQPYAIARTREPVLLPHPGLAARIDTHADRVGAELVVLDPALPLGLVGPRLRHPYAVVVHGAEVAVPGRLPGTRALLGSVLRPARLVIAAGTYPAAEARRAAGRALPTVNIPPGVDTARFHPLDAAARADARRAFALPLDGPVVVGVSRLVPRKGFDRLIEAAARLQPRFPGLAVAIAGSGRDRGRLGALVERTGAPVRLLGRVPDADLPALYGCADVCAMLCRTRWGGLEQEGFGIVFVEAAAAGVPQLAGASGGAAEAVEHGVTGWVVRRPDDAAAVADGLERLLADDIARRAMAVAGRRRVERDLSWDVLAARLAAALEAAAP